VTAVADTGTATYLVTFNRSLVNCVVDATAGTGNPTGTIPLAGGTPRIPVINMAAGAAAGDDAQALVAFETDAGAAIDTSFMITAFC
jgi:hypothetical protein